MMAPDLLPSMQACGMWLCTGVELTLVALVFTFFIYHVSYDLGANSLYQTLLRDIDVWILV